MPAYRFIPPGSTLPTPARIGPWEYGGALYGVFINAANYDGVPFRPSMYKSTDHGATWAIVNPQTSGWTNNQVSAAHGVYSCDRYGDAIYLLWGQRGGVAGADQVTLRVARFSLTTDTWTADISGAGPTIAGYDAASNNAGDHADRPLKVLVARKTDGALCIAYTSATNASGRGVASYVTYTPGVGWGTPVTLRDDSARNHYPVAALSSNAGKIHWFLCSDTDSVPTTGSTRQLHHVTLDAAGTLHTYQTLSADIGRAWYGGAGQPDIGDNGAYEELAITALSASTTAGLSSHLLFTAPEGDTPAWATETLPMPGGDFYLDNELNALNAFASCCAYTSGTQAIGFFFFSQNYFGTSTRGSNDYREYFIQYPPSASRLNVIVGTYDEPGATAPPTVVNSRLWRMEKTGPGAWTSTVIYTEENDYLLGAPASLWLTAAPVAAGWTFSYLGSSPVGGFGGTAGGLSVLS